jgi:hypothetical protein
VIRKQHSQQRQSLLGLSTICRSTSGFLPRRSDDCWRKQIGERVMAIKFVSEIAHDIVRKPGEAGHVCDPPTGLEMKEPDRWAWG